MYTKVKDKPYCGVNQRKIVESNPQLRTNELFEFVQMIKDRYRIHKRKDVQGKPKPWTNNPIMQQYKFTNVRREHDRETKWLIEHITSNPNVSYNNKILNCILFRMFNKHQTSELIQQPIDFKKLHQNPDKYKHSLSAAKLSGQILFTNAFYTTGMRQGVQKCLQGNNLPSDFSGNDILRYVDYLYQDVA